MRQLNFALPLIFLLFIACSGNPDSETKENEIPSIGIEFTGNTQGTTFAIFCNDDIAISYEEIEEILHQFDLALSRYIPNSIVTGINEAPAGSYDYIDSNNYFNRCYELSQQMYALTNGAFDPTVGPVLNIWGFNEEVEHIPDSSTVDSLRALIGFNDGYHFSYIKEHSKDTSNRTISRIIKRTPNARLDFNAIAQGIAVDVLAEELERRGAKNYFVEIGGEIRVKGKNADGVFWRIGIDKPIENSSAENREIQEIVQLDNKSIATSGSYRKFYEKNGVKYSHTINPKTGRPVEHGLLSATVVADDCGTADALATAFMVMGPDKSMQFLKDHPDLNVEVYLIFNNDKERMETYFTEGFQALITE